jgi:hypothetical protein
MEELIEYMRKFGGIGDAHEALIRKHATELALARYDIFLELGEVPSRIGYVANGVLGAVRCNPCGGEVIDWFAEKRTFVTGFSQFVRQMPSEVSVQAVTNAKMIVFGEATVRELSRNISGWDEILKNFSNRDAVDWLSRRQSILGHNARTRYHNFELRYPDLVDRIPQSMISAYLGLAPATVSRIRRSIKSHLNDAKGARAE